MNITEQFATMTDHNITDIFDQETFVDWLVENMDQFRYLTGLEMYFRRKNFNYPASFMVREDKTGYHGILHVDLNESSFINLADSIKVAPKYVFADYEGFVIYLWLSSKFSDADLTLVADMNNNAPGINVRVYAIKVSLVTIDDSLPAVMFEQVAGPPSSVSLENNGENSDGY